MSFLKNFCSVAKKTQVFKILCLHGYRQNADTFRAQTGSFRKIFKNEAEFYFLNAPHVIPNTETLENLYGTQRAWWFTTPLGFSSKDVTDYDEGLDESIREIEKYFSENGPFEGIMGFSQGAALVGLLCALKQKNKIQINFNFVIIVAGFKSQCTLHTEYYDQKININSLHVIGDTDRIINSKMSYDLVNVFVNPAILKHVGGHFVPGQSNLKKDYINFINEQKKVNN